MSQPGSVWVCRTAVRVANLELCQAAYGSKDVGMVVGEYEFIGIGGGKVNGHVVEIDIPVVVATDGPELVCRILGGTRVPKKADGDEESGQTREHHLVGEKLDCGGFDGETGGATVRALQDTERRNSLGKARCYEQDDARQ